MNSNARPYQEMLSENWVSQVTPLAYLVRRVQHLPNPLYNSLMNKSDCCTVLYGEVLNIPSLCAYPLPYSFCLFVLVVQERCARLGNSVLHR